jgi:hypothetical protein
MAAPEPQATTAGTYTPILTDFLRLVRAPFAPSGVFEEQREKPTFWMPWLVLSVFFVALSVLMLPITQQIMRVAAEARGQPMPASAGTITTVITLVSAPVGLLIGALISAVVLYLIVMVSGGEARFSGLMCISIFLAPITFFQTAVTFIVLRMRGLESIQTQADMRVSLGLDLLLPSGSEAPKALAALLRGIGPFEIWSLCICAVALMALEKVPKGKAWTVAVISFVIGLVIRAGSALVFKM